jgi:hypothetical protein
VLDLSLPIVVSDPQVLKELEFMRDEKIISTWDYEIMLRMENIPFVTGTGMDDQSYPTCFGSSCDTANTRLGIQNMMKDKAEGKSITP